LEGVEAQEIKKVIGRLEVKEIIEFIKENPGTTMDRVVAKLKNDGITSRLTTLSMIDKLVQIGIIVDDRRGGYSHKLRYNENYDWEGLALSLLTSSIDEIASVYKELSQTQAITWVNELKTWLVRNKIKEEPEPLEMVQIHAQVIPKHSHSAAIPKRSKNKRKNKKT
jgi:hypothetical protein